MGRFPALPQLGGPLPTTPGVIRLRGLKGRMTGLNPVLKVQQ